VADVLVALSASPEYVAVSSGGLILNTLLCKTADHQPTYRGRRRVVLSAVLKRYRPSQRSAGWFVR